MGVVQRFEDWYEAVHPKVIGVVYVACGDADVAADAADEAFTRALGRWTRVAEMASPEAWVCQVAVNVMRRRLRRSSLESRLLSRRRGEPTTLTEPVAYPEVWQAVRQLPERRRLAVLLRYVADLTEAEIARAMGVTRGTVSTSLIAARNDLASALGGFREPTEMEAPNA